MNAKQHFVSLVGEYVNKATPNIIQYGRIGESALYQLAYGEIFDEEVLYGVTVLLYDEENNYKFSNIDSMCFMDLADAKMYIKDLRREGLKYEDGNFTIYRNGQVHKFKTNR